MIGKALARRYACWDGFGQYQANRSKGGHYHCLQISSHERACFARIGEDHVGAIAHHSGRHQRRRSRLGTVAADIGLEAQVTLLHGTSPRSGVDMCAGFEMTTAPADCGQHSDRQARSGSPEKCERLALRQRTPCARERASGAVSAKDAICGVRRNGNNAESSECEQDRLHGALHDRGQEYGCSMFMRKTPLEAARHLAHALMLMSSCRHHSEAPGVRRSWRWNIDPPNRGYPVLTR